MQNQIQPPTLQNDAQSFTIQIPVPSTLPQRQNPPQIVQIGLQNMAQAAGQPVGQIFRRLQGGSGPGGVKNGAEMAVSGVPRGAGELAGGVQDPGPKK